MTTRALALACTLALGSAAGAQVPTPESVFGHGYTCIGGTCDTYLTNDV